jgi:hypothetical protein
MIDLLALDRLLEVSGRKDRERCRRDEDAFYEEFGADPPAFIVAIGRVLSFLVSPLVNATRAESGRLPAGRELSTCCSEWGAYTLVVPQLGGSPAQ